MANQAAKKTQKASSAAAARFLPWLIGCNAIYFLVRVVLMWSSFSLRHVFGTLVLGGLYAVSYSGLVNSGEKPAEAYFDIFVLTMATQLGSILTDYAWLLLLLIPGYAMYKFGIPMLRMMMKRSSATDAAGEDADGADDADKEKRRAQRRERRQARSFR